MKKLFAGLAAGIALAASPALAQKSSIMLRLVDTTSRASGWTKCSRYFSYHLEKSGRKFVLFTAQIAGIRQPLVAPTTRMLVYVARGAAEPTAVALVHQDRELITDGFVLLLPWRDAVQARPCLPHAGRLSFF